MTTAGSFEIQLRNSILQGPFPLKEDFTNYALMMGSRKMDKSSSFCRNSGFSLHHEVFLNLCQALYVNSTIILHDAPSPLLDADT